MLIGVHVISAALNLASPTQARVVERADAVTLRIDSGATLASEKLDMRDAGESVVGTLALTLTSKEVIAASTMIDLPRGSRIVAMTLDHGGESLVARPLALEEAQRRFVTTIDPPPEITVPRPPSQRDPALLELEHSGASEVVRLTVFPISSVAPATVTVTFVTPRFDRIDVVAGGKLRESLLRADLVHASADDVELALAPSRIAPGLALYAAPAAAPPSERELASRFDAVIPTLARCAAVDDPDEMQHVSLTVDVDELGRPWFRSSEGANANLLDCLRQVIGTVQFADDAATSLTITFDVVPKRSKQDREGDSK